jgi:hypothetical protein
MKTFLLVLGAFGLLACCTCADASTLSSVDGSKLLSKCHAATKLDDVSPNLTREEYGAAFYCLGFVQGAMDASTVFQTAEHKALGQNSNIFVPHCVPESAGWSQIIRVIVKWLEDNPAKLDLSGYDVIRLSMTQAFPCPTSQ